MPRASQFTSILLFFDATNPSNNSPFPSNLNGNNVIKNFSVIKDEADVPAIYVFNFANNNGFIFVSADYQLRPVLAFVERGEFKKDVVPSGIITWANKTINNIELVRKGLYHNSNMTKAAWADYNKKNNKSSIYSDKADDKVVVPPPSANPCYNHRDAYVVYTTTIGPLLPVTWGQDCSYNDLCPNKTCSDCSQLAVTGCVATAMAQIIRSGSQPTEHLHITMCPCQLLLEMRMCKS